MRLFSLLIIFGSLYISSCQTSPDLVVEIFRHGIRGPENTVYDKTYGDFYSNLMPPGIRQQYILGAALRSTYPKIFGSYNSTELYVRTTQDNRTVQSALSQLYGIYKGDGPNLPKDYPANIAVPPFTQDAINEQLEELQGVNAAIPGNYLPMPVHMLTPVDDFLLQPYADCQAGRALHKNQTDDANVEEVWQKLSATRAAVKAAGIEAEDIASFKLLADTVLCDVYNQKPLPGNLDPTSQDVANLIFFQNWYDVYPGMAAPIQIQMYSTPMLNNFAELFAAKQAGTTPLKALMYGVRESMMVAVLSALNIANVTCLKQNWEFSLTNPTGPLPYPDCIYPSFAASMIFEYYNASAPYIIFKYNGKAIPICNGQTQCPLEQFQALITQVTNGNSFTSAKNWCDGTTSSSQKKENKAEAKVVNLGSGNKKVAFVQVPEVKGADMIDSSMFSGLSTLAKGLLALIAVLSICIVVVLRKIVDAKKNSAKGDNGSLIPLVMGQKV